MSVDDKLAETNTLLRLISEQLKEVLKELRRKDE